jgi:flagellar hook-basal body complex protein FliE
MSIGMAMTGLESTMAKVNIPDTILNTNVSIQPEIKTGTAEFNNVFQTALKSLNETQVGADNAIAQLAAGQNVELHNVMLAVEKASMTLQLALQVKSKITDAYQQVMSMQI